MKKRKLYLRLIGIVTSVFSLSPIPIAVIARTCKKTDNDKCPEKFHAIIAETE